MSSPQFEAFLARLYADRPFLERFLADPGKAMAEARLDPRERRAAAAIDRPSLLLAAHSYECKRNARGLRPPKRPLTRASAAPAAVVHAMGRVLGWGKRTLLRMLQARH
jgi:hypothetical protein